MKNVKKRTFNLKRYETLASTNSELKSLSEPKTPWLTIQAISQTAGKGRHGRTWASEGGKDLTFTTLFPLPEPLKPFLPNITQLAAIAVVQTLEEIGLKPQIKWPNDILVSKRKICGILVEGVYTDQKQEVLVGIGLNVNSHMRTIDGINATSLLEETGEEHSVDLILETIIVRMQQLSELLTIQGLQSIIKILNYYLAYKNEWKNVTIDGKKQEVKIISVTASGELRVAIGNRLMDICSGEISFK